MLLSDPVGDLGAAQQGGNDGGNAVPNVLLDQQLPALPTKDVFFSTGLVRGYDSHADDMQVELVRDAGHFMVDEKPELVTQRALECFGVSQPAPAGHGHLSSVHRWPHSRSGVAIGERLGDRPPRGRVRAVPLSDPLPANLVRELDESAVHRFLRRKRLGIRQGNAWIEAGSRQARENGASETFTIGLHYGPSSSTGSDSAAAARTV